MPRLMTAAEWGGLGEELGSGGQAKVFRLGRDQPFVAKIYHSDQRPSVSALTEVIDWHSSLSDREAAVIDARTSWPHGLLSDETGDVVGVVLPSIPSSYFAELHIQHSRKVRPRELNYLLAPRKSHDLGIATPDLDDRVRICREWVSVFDVLDAHGVVFGDISMRNLLWSAKVDCSGYVIDCDTAQTDPPRAASPWTQDWDDPFLGPGAATQPADIASDRYKLTLVVFRTLVGHPSMRPPATMSGLRGQVDERVPDALLGLIHAGGGADRDGRPRPSDWLSVMDTWVAPNRMSPRVPDRQQPAPQPSSHTATKRRRRVSVGSPPTTSDTRGRGPRAAGTSGSSAGGQAPADGPISAARQRRVHRIDELKTTGGSSSIPQPAAPSEPPQQASSEPPPQARSSNRLRAWPRGVKILLWWLVIVGLAVLILWLS